MKVTDKELQLLKALSLRTDPGRDRWATVPDLRNRRFLDPEGSPQGCWITASSLVRKGLAEKTRSHGLVWLRLTYKGLDEFNQAAGLRHACYAGCAHDPGSGNDPVTGIAAND